MKFVRMLLLALLFSLLLGLAIGTVLRKRLERPTVYIGARPLPLRAQTGPLHVADAGAVVLDPRHHEE